MLNLAGVFLANIAAVGTIFVLTNTKELNVFDGFVLCGFMTGIAIAYFLRGVSIWNLKTGSDIMSYETPRTDG